jgi:hypothetical protein
MGFGLWTLAFGLWSLIIGRSQLGNDLKAKDQRPKAVFVICG